VIAGKVLSVATLYQISSGNKKSEDFKEDIYNLIKLSCNYDHISVKIAGGNALIKLITASTLWAPSKI
jgi:hypothetical protein